MTRILFLLPVLLLTSTAARAEESNRKQCQANPSCRIPNDLVDLTTEADDLAKFAVKARDPVIKRLAPRVEDIADDLNALVAPIRKDGLSTKITNTLIAIQRDTRALENLADDADDKQERRTMREKSRQ